VSEQIHGPRIGDDMVQEHEENVIVNVQAKDMRLDKRALSQVELLAGRARGPTPRRSQSLGARLLFELIDLDREIGGPADDLDNACAVRTEAGSENRMSFHDVPQALLENAEVEAPSKANGEGTVVHRMAGIQSIQEPQALLGKGQGKPRFVGGVASWG